MQTQTTGNKRGKPYEEWDIEDFKQKNQRLCELLFRYGQHLPTCYKATADRSTGAIVYCDCGLEDMLDGALPPEGRPYVEGPHLWPYPNFASREVWRRAWRVIRAARALAGPGTDTRSSRSTLEWQELYASLDYLKHKGLPLGWGEEPPN